MPDDYTAVASPWDEEEERLRKFGGYPPVVASPAAAAPNPSPGSSPMGASAAADSPAVASAPVAASRPLTSGVSPASAPAVASPVLAQPVRSAAQTRLQGLVDQGAPPVQPLHGFKKGLDVLGQIFAPGIEERLRYGPQIGYERDLNRAKGDVEAEQAPAAEQAKTDETQARAGWEKAHGEAIKNPPPVKKSPEEQAFEGYIAQGLSPVDAFRKVKEAAQEAKPHNDSFQEQEYQEWLQKHPKGTRLDFDKEHAAATQKPEREQRVLMAVPQPDGSQKIVEVSPGMTIAGNAAKPGESAHFSRADVTAHDKAYVQPAENVEKSYQMMNSAFNEYEAARKQGKELPTGAQSMLALSTHLSTTFGNVKGARVTKDMIHEHLGARGISDSALVAVQRLTNGDQLSPEQWKAFHDLIGESRKLSWQTAAKEADRKHIPVDFLPEDLRNVGHEPGEGGEPAPSAGQAIRVQIPGHPEGSIPSDQKDAFLKKHPNAKVLQ